MADLRILRTKMNIQNAFVKLVNERGFKHVSVTDIATTAMVNRQTFYKHYQDKYQLADEMIDDFVREYDLTVQKRIQLRDQHASFEDSVKVLMPEFQKLIGQKFEMLSALIGIHTDQPSLEEKMKQVIIERFDNFFPTKMPEFEKVIISSLVVSIFGYLVAHRQMPSPDELQKTFSDITLLLK